MLMLVVAVMITSAFKENKCHIIRSLPEKFSKFAKFIIQVQICSGKYVFIVSFDAVILDLILSLKATPLFSNFQF